MNDKDFDDIFRDGLNKPSGFNFTESKWGKLENKLNDVQDGRRQSRRWIYMAAAGLMIGTILSGSFFTGHEINSAGTIGQTTENRQKVKPAYPFIPPRITETTPGVSPAPADNPPLVQNGQSRANSNPRPKEGADFSGQSITISTYKSGNKNENAHPVLKVDRSFEESVIDIKDIRDKVVFARGTEIRPGHAASKEFNKAPGIAASSNSANNPAVFPVAASTGDRSPAINAEPSLPPLRAQTAENKKIQNIELPGLLPSPKPASLLSDQFSYSFAEGQPAVIRKHDSNKIGWEIGATGGWVFINSYDVRQPNGYTMGLRGGVRLNDRLQLFGEAQYLGLIYGFKRDSLSAEALSVKPPTPDYALKYVTAQKPTIQFSFGVQYFLIATGPVRPYLGLALLAHTELEEKNKYTFRKIQSEEEANKEEYKRNPKIDIEALRIPAGIDLALSKNIKLKAEAAYDFALRPTSSYRPAWNIKTGLFLQFPHRL